MTTPTPILWLDLETTGLHAEINAPLAIACEMLGGPDHGAKFHGRMRPHPNAAINDVALTVNGYNRNLIETFPHQEETFKLFVDFIDLLAAGTEDYILLGGWNFSFDDKFLREWFRRNNQMSKYGFVFNPEYREASTLLKATYADYKTRFGGLKLAKVYEGIFGHPMKDAHTELGDVYGTRQVYLHCDQRGEGHYAKWHHLLPENQTQTTNTDATDISSNS